MYFPDDIVCAYSTFVKKQERACKKCVCISCEDMEQDWTKNINT